MVLFFSCPSSDRYIFPVVFRFSRPRSTLLWNFPGNVPQALPSSDRVLETFEHMTLSSPCSFHSSNRCIFPMAFVFSCPRRSPSRTVSGYLPQVLQRGASRTGADDLHRGQPRGLFLPAGTSGRRCRNGCTSLFRGPPVRRWCARAI